MHQQREFDAGDPLTCFGEVIGYVDRYVYVVGRQLYRYLALRPEAIGECLVPVSQHEPGGRASDNVLLVLVFETEGVPYVVEGRTRIEAIGRRAYEEVERGQYLAP